MSRPSFRPAMLMLMAALGLGAGTGGAFLAFQLLAPAPPAQPAAPEPSDLPERTTEQFGSWAYQCEQGGAPESCYLSYALANRATGERLLQLFIERQGEAAVAVFDLPGDADPLKSVTLSAAGTVLTAELLTGCGSGRCEGRALITPAMLDAMKGGGEAEVALTRAGAPRTHKVLLDGFAAAYARLTR